MSFPLHARDAGATAEELTAAAESHDFDWSMSMSEVPRCVWCDSRFGSASASWPCGTSVPRVTA